MIATRRFLLALVLGAALLIAHHAFGGEQEQRKLDRVASLRVLVLTFHVADTTSQMSMAWEPGSLPDSVSVELLDGKGAVASRVYYHGRPGPAPAAR